MHNHDSFAPVVSGHAPTHTTSLPVNQDQIYNMSARDSGIPQIPRRNGTQILVLPK
uniref:Uncharacterized protein n=1 Tax=Arundo donax TaxID=35708 RepID=A0A0A8Z8X6_ARUDO